MIDNGLYVDKPLLRHSTIQQFTLAAGVNVLIGHSAKRVRLDIYGTGLHTVLLFLGPSSIAQPNSLTLATGRPYFFLDKDLHGSLVQLSVEASGTVGDTVTVIETVAD